MLPEENRVKATINIIHHAHTIWYSSSVWFLRYANRQTTDMLITMCHALKGVK